MAEMEKYILASVEDRIHDRDVWDVYYYQGVHLDNAFTRIRALAALKELCAALYQQLQNDDSDYVLECIEELDCILNACSCYSKYKRMIVARISHIQEVLLYENCDANTIQELIDSTEVIANCIVDDEPGIVVRKRESFQDWIADVVVKPEPEPEEFNGVVYPSAEALANAYGISLHTYQVRMIGGWTQEEALGIVLRIDKDPLLADKFYDIDAMQPGVRFIFNENIYCVLGISAKSSRAEVLTNRDKLEKYHKIGALASYKTPYEMASVQKPNRDLGHLQVVLSRLGVLEDRWLWFEQDKYIKFWNAKIIERLRYDSNEYDEVLASYFNVLISDPLFTKKNKWNKVLQIIDSWLQKTESDLYKIILGHVSADDKNKYNYKMIVSSFRNTILTPLQNNILEGNSSYIIAAFPFWRESTVSFASDFIEKCVNRAMEMANSQLASIVFTVQTIPDNNHPSERATSDMVSVTEAFLDFDYRELVRLAEALANHELYSDIIKEKIRKNLWDAGYIVWKGGNDKSAARIFSSIYAFCNDENKKQIKNTFSLELLVEMSSDDFTDDEVLKIADKHDRNKDYDSAIKWYRVGAERGKSQALNKLGEYYEVGHGVEKNASTAYSWFVKAAEKGDISARRKLAPVYYSGNAYILKNHDRAQEYWISVFIEYPYSHNETQLNRYFPGWKTSENDAYRVLRNKKKRELERLAEEGIAAAAYWLGENLYSPGWMMKTFYDYEEDKNAARRWLLKAALAGYSPAYYKLTEHYGINAREAATPSAMYQCGVKYSNDKSEQGKDLTFYWYRKAVDAGYEGACNNLGVCYDDATGTDKNYETANELYLRAIKYNENSGAYHNYGVNLFYGCGVDEDKEKAKQYLLKARDKGSEAARRFLKEHYGITDRLSIGFDAIEDTEVFDNDGLRVEFCGLKTLDDGFELRFWVNNHGGTQYNIWAKKINLNGTELKGFSKVGEFEDGEGHFRTVKFDNQLKPGDVIELSVEIDDANDDEICTTNRFKITIDTNTSKPVFNIIGILVSPSLKVEEDEENSYAFASEDFDDVTIYDKNGIRIDFCGFEVDDTDDSVSMRFWVSNSSSVSRKIWVINTWVDGDDADIMEMIGEYKPGDRRYTSVSIPQVDLEYEYFIEMSLEVDDTNNTAIDEVGKLNVTIDFSAEEIDVEVENEEAAKGDTTDVLYSPGSYYVLNGEHNGIEIYFPSKPKESIRDALKAARWRWFQSKGCWYTYNSAANKDLANRITGNNMRR